MTSEEISLSVVDVLNEHGISYMLVGSLVAQGELLDWPYIERWCDQHGTRKLLEQLRAEVRRNSR